VIKVKKKYKFTVVATDVVIFTVQDKQLKVLLIKMKKNPYLKHWAVPGGLVNPDESVDNAAKRHLFDKTGVKNIFLEQLCTFGKVNRDPFGRVVSVAYFALIPSENLKLRTTEEYGNARWFSVEDLPDFAYDHKKMIDLATKRLQAKLSYSNIVYGLLPREFTLTELQKVYEIILGKCLDKRNFRKKISSTDLLEKLRKKRKGLTNRPAVLYKFTRRKPQMIEIL